MNPPYLWRIVAALPGQAPIEIMRSNHTYTMKDWLAWTRDMDSAWEKWCEGRMPDNRCLTPRIVVGPLHGNKVTLYPR